MRSDRESGVCQRPFRLPPSSWPLREIPRASFSRTFWPASQIVAGTKAVVVSQPWSSAVDGLVHEPLVADGLAEEVEAAVLGVLNSMFSTRRLQGRSQLRLLALDRVFGRADPRLFSVSGDAAPTASLPPELLPTPTSAVHEGVRWTRVGSDDELTWWFRAWRSGPFGWYADRARVSLPRVLPDARGTWGRRPQRTAVILFAQRLLRGDPARGSTASAARRVLFRFLADGDVDVLLF